MKMIELPENFNYIAVFLTFACQYDCTYCINRHSELKPRQHLTPKEWINALNHIEQKGIPFTLQGGEPTIYKGFYDVVNGIERGRPIDLLSNGDFDPEVFIQNIKPERFKREAPYASIRISYHQAQEEFPTFVEKILKLKRYGYSIGVFEVDHPDYHKDVLYRQSVARAQDIDWRLKEFLGMWKGKLYGTFKYDKAVSSRTLSHCMCRTTELLIDPAGKVFRCHSDLYSNRCSLGSIFDNDIGKKLGKDKLCLVYGKCNACDIKVKNNRFQEWGHSSVVISDLHEPYADNMEVVNGYES